jgi:hypothetical protein
MAGSTVACGSLRAESCREDRSRSHQLTTSGSGRLHSHYHRNTLMGSRFRLRIEMFCRCRKRRLWYGFAYGMEFPF